MNVDFLETIDPKSNYDLISHEENIDFILKSYKKERLHQAYIFSGTEGIGKATFAYSLARFLLSDLNLDGFTLDRSHKVSKLIESNTHPDLLIIEPTSNKKDRFISIDQARRCSDFFSHTPSMSKWRICIIDSIDFMDINSSNTILKILEEPPSYCLFMIIAQKIDSVIDTIRSRCIELKFKDINNDIITKKLKLLKPELLDSEVSSFVNLSEGSIGKLNDLVKEESLNIHKELENIILNKEISSSIYSFSDFILKEDATSNKFNFFVNCIIFKVNLLVKRLAISNSPRVIKEGLDLRGNILKLVQQERVFKLNKKQTIISLITNLNKLVNL